MKLKVYGSDGSDKGVKEFPEFPSFERQEGIKALKDAIIAYQANLRQGNASTKTRGEVRGSGKKPYRQKGTGNARHGEKRSPIWVHGGVVFGPKPRDYSLKLNQKVKSLALSRALFNQASSESLALIDAFESNEVKTKPFATLIEKIQPSKKVLLVDVQFKDNVALSARNIPQVFLVDAASVNAWDVVRYESLIFTEEALRLVLARCSKGGKAK